MPPTPTATQIKRDEVVTACRENGKNAIIALSGVPGTGKSTVAQLAGQLVATQPEMVKEIQFSPSWTYDEFIEGLRLGDDGTAIPTPGVFLSWNQLALDDPSHIYVLLIEEFTRARIPLVIGELLTYVEHRNRPFFTRYSGRPIKIAENLIVLVTFNPNDRSALEIDDAILRRMRIVHCAPDTGQLRDMLSEAPAPLVDQIAAIFDRCRDIRPNDWDFLMPFGHGIFAGIKQESDLRTLWKDRIKHILYRPLKQPHPFAECIARNYPWK